MDVRTGDNKRESWWVRNLTNKTITIGDLLLVPAIKPGKRIDLLHYYTREKIGHSTVLVSLVKARIVSLDKDKIFGTFKIFSFIFLIKYRFKYNFFPNF